MSPQEKVSQLWGRIPRRMFGGRMRTSTAVMCVLWLALATLNSYLIDQANTEKARLQRTGVEQSQPYDPAPAMSPQTSSSTTTTTPPPSETSTSSTPPSQSEASRSDRQSGTTTTTPGAGRGTTTQQETSGQSTTTTEAPQQSQEPADTTAGAEATTVPSPEG